MACLATSHNHLNGADNLWWFLETWPQAWDSLPKPPVYPVESYSYPDSNRNFLGLPIKTSVSQKPYNIHHVLVSS